jgi:serine/threonine protein kinase
LIGHQLAQFRIIDLLGEGGMGAVYRAEDTELGREVAIKVLPEAFVADPERLARFEREAKVLAALDHPNVAGIYQVGRAGEGSEPLHFIAMQLAPGEDLAAVLGRGPLPPEMAIDIALQICEGLEAAHESGIVHRDLKPGNIMVDSESASGLAVKLLDFGLAKPREQAPSDPNMTHSPTLTAHMTGAGTILGTAAYMSPEQARGKLVDKRADIWAFGCVLFEMLTGRRPFEGSDITEVLAAVIRARPEFEALPEAVPKGVRDLIERCLHKEPRSRLRDIGDARTVLEEIRDNPEVHASPAPSQPASRLSTLLPWALVAILAAIGLTRMFAGSDSQDSAPPLRRFSIDLPWQSVPNWTDFGVAISPTGTHIAHNGRVYNRVDAYLRPLDSLDSHPVAPAREAAWMFFSPAGDWMGIVSGTQMSKVPIRGGRAELLANTGELDTYGFSWGTDDDILIGTTLGLHRIPAQGGPIEAVTRVSDFPGEKGHMRPAHLPGGKQALISIMQDEGPPTLGVVELADGSITRLPLNGFAAIYARSGHLIFQQGSTSMAIPFDPESLSIQGDPVPVLEEVELGPYIADDGTMIYVPTRGESNAHLVWVDRKGALTPVPAESLNYSHLDLSNDGETALLNVNSDVYAIDLDRGTRQKLAEGSLFPIFTPDDLSATFRQSPRGITPIGAIVRRAFTGDGSVESLVEGNDTALAIEGDLTPARSTVPTSWNPRTGDLAFFDNASDIWIRKADGSAALFLDSDANERTGRFSPDGRWLAYVSDETGEYQIYVVPYPGPGPRMPVSIEGGLSPIWSPDGTERFYRNGGKLMSVSVTHDPEISFGPPVELFEGPFTLDLMGHQRWDVAPDGQSFLMVENSQDYRIIVVQNWFEELERLVPTKR